jgi:hypothetical protein
VKQFLRQFTWRSGRSGFVFLRHEALEIAG